MPRQTFVSQTCFLKKDEKHISQCPSWTHPNYNYIEMSVNVFHVELLGHS